MSSFPGQNGPVAPTPAAGGFAPVAPMHAAPQGFAPQPGGGFGAPPQAQAFAPQVQPQYAPQPQAFGGAPQAQQFNAQPQATAPLFNQAELEALRAAQMGKGKREMLPAGQYVVVAESTEFYDANANKGAPNRALALLFVVESSDNPHIQTGHRAKVSEFFDTKYKESQLTQLNKFKAFVGRLYGAQSLEQLNAIAWENDLLKSASDTLRGARYHISVTRDLDNAGRVKIDTHGREKTRSLIQRIG